MPSTARESVKVASGGMPGTMVRHHRMAWVSSRRGAPCRGRRCRSWISGVSLSDWRGRRGRTGANSAAGSGSVRKPATNGWPALGSGRRRGADRPFRGGHNGVRRAPPMRWKPASSNCVTRIRPGAPARSRVAWSGSRPAAGGLGRCYAVLRRRGRIGTAPGGSVARGAVFERSGAEPVVADGLQGLGDAGAAAHAAIP